MDRSADLLSVILRSYQDVTLVITLPQLLWLLSLRLQLYVHVEKCSHGALYLTYGMAKSVLQGLLNGE